MSWVTCRIFEHIGCKSILKTSKLQMMKKISGLMTMVSFIFSATIQFLSAQCITINDDIEVINLQAGGTITKSSLNVDRSKPVVIRVSGYNPLLYNVRINAKDSSLKVGDTPKLISGLSTDFLKWFEGLGSNILNPEKIFLGNEQAIYLETEDRAKLLNDQISFNLASLILNVNSFYATASDMYHAWYYDAALQVDSYFSTNFTSLRKSISLDLIRLVELNQEVRSAMITTNIAGFKSTLDSLDKKIDYYKINAILTDYRNYISCNGEYYSLPFFLSDDMKEVSVEIAPYSKDTKAPSFNTTLMIKSKKNIFFGFSSGFFLSDVRSHNYSAKQVSGSFPAVYSPVAENVHKNQIGIQAMVHAGIELYDWSVVQLGVGPTLGFQEKIVPGLALGAGIGIGRKKKVMITSGYHFSFVQRLSRAYDDPGIRITEVPSSFTVTSLEKGWFLSLGFNFLTF